MKSTLLLLLFVAPLLCPARAVSQVDSCPFSVPGTYECSNDKPPCHQMKPYFYCNGTGNLRCCTESLNEIVCCGQVLSNAYNVGTCGVDCGNSGLVVEPITGRISKVCMGPLLTAAATGSFLPSQPSRPARTNSPARKEPTSHDASGTR
jgi:hypothetical protein